METINESLLEEIIDFTGILENNFSIACLTGGRIFIDSPSKEEVIKLFKKYRNTDVKLYDILKIEKSLKQIEKIYKSPKDLYREGVDQTHIGFYFPNGVETGFLSLDEHIDLLFMRRLDKNVISKTDFRRKIDNNIIINAGFVKTEADKIKDKAQKQKKSKGVKGVVYLIKVVNKNKYKIGLTSNLKRRIKDLSTQNPFEIKLINTIKSNNTYKLERKLHEKFADKNIKGEWFELSQKDVNYINQIADDNNV